MVITKENQERMQEGRMKSGKWGGQPAKYTNPEELEFQITEFFDGFEEDHNIIKLYDKKGKEVGFEYKQLPTVSGLTLFLGFSDRRSLLDYIDRDEKRESKDPEYIKEYSHLIKGAKTFIEQTLENRLALGKGSPAGQIFILKNGFNWRDKIESEIYGKDGKDLIVGTVEFIKPDPKEHEAHFEEEKKK